MNSETASSRWYRNLVLATIGIFLIVLAAFFTRRKPDTGPAAELEQMLLVERDVVSTYDEAKKAFAEGKIDAQTFVDVIKSEVLAPWREAEARFRKVDADKLSDKGKKLFESLEKSMKLREQAWGLVVDSIRDGSEEGMASAAQKAAEADRIEDEIMAELEASRERAAEDEATNKRPK
ncbi:MAG TPA: hypothetical protein VG826_15560 [Pirellulales bacterium]|nr:hypothetical protein [Pirellulales bacterium]